jgi:hypothetical protein
MGVLPLRIETGRYEGCGVVGCKGIPVEFRVCQCCDLCKVEDEIHFLVECPFFVKERVGLLRTCSQEFSKEGRELAEDKERLFIQMMQAESAKVWRAIADFVCTAYKRRVVMLKALHVS